MMTTGRDRIRQSTQCERILDALMRGPLMNTDLIHYGLSYTRRIADLREQGYNVLCNRIGSNGLTEYRLVAGGA